MELPSEILHHIFQYLRGEALYQIAIVNRHWHEVSTSETLWKLICKFYHFETWEENHIGLLDSTFFLNGSSFRINPNLPECNHQFDYEECEAIRPRKKRKLDPLPYKLRVQHYRRFYYQLMPWKCNELKIFDGSIVHKLPILLKSMQNSDIESVTSGTIDEITHVGQLEEDVLDEEVLAVNNLNGNIYIPSTMNTSIDQNVNNHRIEEEIDQNVTIDTSHDILKEDSNSAVLLQEFNLTASPQQTAISNEISEAVGHCADASSSSVSDNSQGQLNALEHVSNGSQSANTDLHHGHGSDDESSFDDTPETFMDYMLPFSKLALKTVPFMGGYFGFTLGRDDSHYLTVLNGAAGGRTVILELPNKEKILLDTPIFGCRKTALDTFDDEESTRKQFWYTWLHFKHNYYNLYDRVLKGGIIFHRDLTYKMTEDKFTEIFPHHENHHNEKDLTFKKIPDFLCGIRGHTVLHFVKKKLTGKIWTFSQDEPYIRQAPRDIFVFLLEHYNMIKQKVTEHIGDDLVNFEEEKTFTGNGRDLYHCVRNLMESGCTDEVILDSALWTLKGGNKFTLKMCCGVKADDFFSSFIILLREVVKINAKQASIITASKFFSHFNNLSRRKTS